MTSGVLTARKAWVSAIKRHLLACLLIWGGLISAHEAQAGGVISGTVRWGPGGAPETVVYIEKVQGQFPAANASVMDQEKLTYVPHVLPILQGATVEFRNSDPLLHNVHAYREGKTLFNLGIPKGLVTKKRFNEEGVVLLLCDVHPEMSAYIIVLQNPFFARTNGEGKYRIQDVPPGPYRLKTWHEKVPPQTAEVEVREGQETRADFRLGR